MTEPTPDYRYIRFFDGRFLAFNRTAGFHVADAGHRTYFELTPTRDDRVFLRCAHGGYLSATPDGVVGPVVEASGWEAFSLDACGGGDHRSGTPVLIRSLHGAYLTANPGTDRLVVVARPEDTRPAMLEQAFHAEHYEDAVRCTAPLAPTDRVVWTFWHRGRAAMSPLCKLNVEVWHRVLGPDWRIVVLDAVHGSAHHVDHIVDRGDLPRSFERLNPVVQSDAIRLALLKTHGGVWMDPSILLLRSLDDICWRRMADADSGIVLAGFANPTWGSDHHGGHDYFENWFIAARRNNAFVEAWHRAFVDYWHDLTQSTSSWSHPLFKCLDLSTFQRHGSDFRNYLIQHIAFRRVIEHDPHMKEVWRRNMLLADAAEAFLITKTAGWSSGPIFRVLLERKDEDLAGQLLATPLMKFTGCMRRHLERVPEDALLDPRHTLGFMYRHVLECKPRVDTLASIAVPRDNRAVNLNYYMEGSVTTNLTIDHKFIGVKINIQTSNGHFVTAVNGGGLGEDNTVPFFTTKNLSSSALFTLVPLDRAGDTVAIVTINGHYVTAVKGGGIGGPNDATSPLHTDAVEAGLWEEFTLKHHEKGDTYAIQTTSGYYLTANNGGGLGERANEHPLHTDAISIDTWEKFKLILVD